MRQWRWGWMDDDDDAWRLLKDKYFFSIKALWQRRWHIWERGGRQREGRREGRREKRRREREGRREGRERKRRERETTCIDHHMVCNRVHQNVSLHISFLIFYGSLIGCIILLPQEVVLRLVTKILFPAEVVLCNQSEYQRIREMLSFWWTSLPTPMMNPKFGPFDIVRYRWMPFDITVHRLYIYGVYERKRSHDCMQADNHRFCLSAAARRTRRLGRLWSRPSYSRSLRPVSRAGLQTGRGVGWGGAGWSGATNESSCVPVRCIKPALCI